MSETTSTSIATATPVLGATAKRKEEKKKKEEKIVEESGYSIYNDGDKRVFEINDYTDYQVFNMGLQMNNPRQWRGNETCNEFLNDYNTNRSHNYSVRWNGSDVQPSRSLK